MLLLDWPFPGAGSSWLRVALEIQKELKHWASRYRSLEIVFHIERFAENKGKDERNPVPTLRVPVTR